MKAFIETKSIKESDWPSGGCFAIKLRNPIDGKWFAVIDYETRGKERLPNLRTGGAFSSNVEYVVGIDAILIKEILE